MPSRPLSNRCSTASEHFCKGQLTVACTMCAVALPHPLRSGVAIFNAYCHPVHEQSLTMPPTSQTPSGCSITGSWLRRVRCIAAAAATSVQPVRCIALPSAPPCLLRLLRCSDRKLTKGTAAVLPPACSLLCCSAPSASSRSLAASAAAAASPMRAAVRMLPCCCGSSCCCSCIAPRGRQPAALAGARAARMLWIFH
jgi:hypothetical protein